MPHEPQLLASVWVSTQALPQMDPLVHAHLPAVQVDCAGQALPHVPQLVALVEVSVQTPLHLVVHAPASPPLPRGPPSTPGVVVPSSTGMTAVAQLEIANPRAAHAARALITRTTMT